MEKMKSDQLRGKSNLRRKIIRSPEFTIAIALIVLICIVTIKDATFISEYNIVSMLNYASYTGIIAIPLVFILVARYVDLSVGAMMGMLSICLAYFVKNSTMPFAVSILLVLAIGALVGFINGILILKLRISSFILTLAMMYTCRGVMQVVAGGRNIDKLPKDFLMPGDIEIGPVPLNVIFFLLVALVGWIILQKTTFGKSVYIIGNNETIAKTSGINVDKTCIILYVAVGIACAASAYFMTVGYRVGNIASGTGWEFEIQSACMLGGCSMYGGKGTILGGVLGVLFMTVLRYALQVFNWGSGYQIMMIGIVLVVSVLIDLLRTRKLSA